MSVDKSALSATRIVALAVIALLTAALVYLHLEVGEEPISVPPGAEPGELTLMRCTYATEAGDLDAECGILPVPENRAEPESRLIAIPVVRIRAQAEQPQEPIFLLWGGPGVTNMTWPQASRFTDAHDVVLVGYRGVDGSVRLDCPEVGSALAHSTDFLGEDSFRAYGEAFRACAERLTGEGVDLAGYGLTHQVDDLEAARAALGYDRINLVSESAGTRIAMIYAWRFPDSIHRSVMVGVNPPGNFLWSPQTTNEQLDRYADLCAADANCSSRTDDLAAQLRQTSADMPHRWLLLPINRNNVRVFAFYGLMESTAQEAPLSAPWTIDSWLAAAHGDSSGFWFTSLLADYTSIPFVWGHYAAAARLDAQAARDYFSAGASGRGANLGYAGSAFAWGGGELAEVWPAAPDEGGNDRIATSKVPTLLIGGELDTSTPPQVATTQLLPYLPEGQQVILPGFGHTATFWADQPQAGTRLVSTFLDTGKVDASRYEPGKVDFSADPSLPTLGKLVAGIMTGLPVLAVASMLLLRRRVQTRGRLGPVAKVLTRSGLPIVLGLAGWLLGVLIVTFTMPAVALGSRLLATISVSTPVALGIYLGWVHRDWSARTKTTGLVAATTGSILAAWPGSNTIGGPLALTTTILAATLGANLLMLIFDIAGHGGETAQTEAPEA